MPKYLYLFQVPSVALQLNRLVPHTLNFIQQSFVICYIGILLIYISDLNDKTNLSWIVA